MKLTGNPYLDTLRNPLGTPQFPGGDFLQMNIEQIRSLIKTQKRAKGFRFNLPLGTSNFNLDISGTAKVFLGFIFGGSFGIPPISDSFSLTINNEIIIQDGNTQAFGTDRFQGNNEFFYFPRPLTGTDEITVRFDTTIGGTELLDVWYL